MKVLHLFSNSKWTGPAEPALNLCVALRGLGVEADFACAPGSPRFPNKVVESARARGMEPLLQFRLDKHQHPIWNFLDARKLDRFLTYHRYDLLHCHLDNDHRIAHAANKRHKLPLLRSSYTGTGFTEPGIGKMLRGSEMILEPSQIALEHDTTHFGLQAERLRVIPVAVDTARFDPARVLPDGRARLGLPPEALLIGIVARMQTHRHYEDLFHAFKQVREKAPQAHLVVIGRGSKQDQVGFRPVETLGLRDSVHFTGYLDGDDYVGMLQAFDFAVFLVPGSDGTCRAVRELMSMGKPMVVADRGMLREIVTHERDGLVCDGSVGGLEQALGRLAMEPGLRARMSAAARARASGDFALRTQAKRVVEVYEEVLSRVG